MPPMKPTAAHLKFIQRTDILIAGKTVWDVQNVSFKIGEVFYFPPTQAYVFRPTVVEGIHAVTLSYDSMSTIGKFCQEKTEALSTGKK